MSLTTVERKYVCTSCKAEDHWKEEPNEIIPPVLNCWNCKAGYGMDIGSQLQNRKGMFPVDSEPTSISQKAARAN